MEILLAKHTCAQKITHKARTNITHFIITQDDSYKTHFTITQDDSYKTLLLFSNIYTVLHYLSKYL